MYGKGSELIAPGDSDLLFEDESNSKESCGVTIPIPKTYNHQQRIPATTIYRDGRTFRSRFLDA